MISKMLYWLNFREERSQKAFIFVLLCGVCLYDTLKKVLIQRETMLKAQKISNSEIILCV